MKNGALLHVLLVAALLLATGVRAVAQTGADPATILAMKRVAERYALTKARITALLDRRMNPVPLPANLPNPFYHAPDVPAADGAAPDATGSTVVPVEAADTDAGTLAKFVAGLKISGLSVMNGVAHLTLNSTLCKEGDIIPYDVKGRTIYIQVKKLTPDELILALNDEHQTIRVRR